MPITITINEADDNSGLIDRLTSDLEVATYDVDRLRRELADTKAKLERETRRADGNLKAKDELAHLLNRADAKIADLEAGEIVLEVTQRSSTFGGSWGAPSLIYAYTDDVANGISLDAPQTLELPLDRRLRIIDLGPADWTGGANEGSSS